MALTKCPECGKNVKCENDICTNCGYPLGKMKIKNKKNCNSHRVLFYLIVVILIMGSGILFIFKDNLFSSLSKKNYVACFEKKNICITNKEVQEMTSNTSNTDVSALIYLLDEKLLKSVYSKESDKVKKQVDDSLKQYKNQFDDEEEYSRALSYYGNSIEEVKRTFSLSFYQERAIEDYAKRQIKEEEIKKYYKEKVSDSVRVSHILLTGDDALDISRHIIDELDSGATFSELAKKYSNDYTTKNDGGNLGFVNNEDYPELYYVASNLKLNTYTKEPVMTEFGYHIVLKTSENGKPKLKEIKDDIFSKLVKDLRNSDNNFSEKALQKVRNEYDLKIYDETLKVKYDEYLKKELSEKGSE